MDDKDLRRIPVRRRPLLPQSNRRRLERHPNEDDDDDADDVAGDPRPPPDQRNSNGDSDVALQVHRHAADAGLLRRTLIVACLLQPIVGVAPRLGARGVRTNTNAGCRRQDGIGTGSTAANKGLGVLALLRARRFVAQVSDLGVLLGQLILQQILLRTSTPDFVCQRRTQHVVLRVGDRPPDKPKACRRCRRRQRKTTTGKTGICTGRQDEWRVWGPVLRCRGVTGRT
jgi:hypothetical protein